jgi:hypothetical protein
MAKAPDWSAVDTKGFAAAMAELRGSLRATATGLSADLKTALEERAKALAAAAKAAGAALDSVRSKLDEGRKKFAEFAEAATAAAQASRSVFAPLNRALDGLAERVRGAAGGPTKALAPLTAALGGVGEAYKAATKPFRELREAAGTALAPLRDLKAGYDTVRGGVGMLLSPLRMLGALPAKAAGALGGMASKGASLLAGPTQQLQSFFGQVQSQIQGLVAAANPGAALRFQMALDDLNATLGAALVPVLDQFTVLARAVGGTINGLTGEGKILIAALAAGAIGMALFSAAALAVQAVLTGGIVPILSAVGGALGGAFGGLALATGQLEAAFKPVMAVFGGIANRLGEVLTKFSGGGALAAVAEAAAEVIGVVIDLGASFLDFLMPAFNAFGQVLKAMAPAFLPLAGVFAMLSGLGPIALLVGGTIAVVAKAFEAAAPYLIAFSEVVIEFGKKVFDVVRQLLSMVGINLPEFKAPQSTPRGNEGMAAKSTSTTDVMSVLAKARESSFAAGHGGQKQDWGQQTAGGVGQLNKKADEIKKAIDDFFKDLPKNLANALKERAKEGARNAGSSIAGAAGSLLLRTNPVTGPAVLAKDLLTFAVGKFG